MGTQAICESPITLHAKRCGRMKISKNRLYLRTRETEIAHECEISILIGLVRLAIKPINKGPELALLRRDLA